MTNEKPDGSRKKKPFDLYKLPTEITVLYPDGPCRNARDAGR